MNNQICKNCVYSQWAGRALVCCNESSDEHMMFMFDDDGCDKFEVYQDEAEMQGAIE